MSIAMTPWAECFIPHPQGRLYARVWEPSATDGSARSSIVLFHDSLGCVELWRDFPRALSSATGRRVVAYDRLGFGRSDPHPGALPLDFVADESVTFVPVVLAHLGIERFVVFGHSVGGGMGVHCAATHANACEALITESAQSFVEERTIRGIEEAKRQFAEPGQLARLERYHGDKAKWVLDAWTETWLSPAFAHWTLDAALPRVTCPLLAIHGAEDEYGTPQHPARIASLAGGVARSEVLEGIHHVPHREAEPDVLSRVVAFLSA